METHRCKKWSTDTGGNCVTVMRLARRWYFNAKRTWGFNSWRDEIERVGEYKSVCESSVCKWNVPAGCFRAENCEESAPGRIAVRKLDAPVCLEAAYVSTGDQTCGKSRGREREGLTSSRTKWSHKAKKNEGSSERNQHTSLYITDVII